MAICFVQSATQYVTFVLYAARARINFTMSDSLEQRTFYLHIKNPATNFEKYAIGNGKRGKIIKFSSVGRCNSFA